MRRSPPALIVLAVSFLLSACVDRTVPTAPDTRAFTISDGAHAGNAHFFFLPPMVPNPSTNGVFDGSLSPSVQICEWSGASCGAVVATFTMTSGPGSETVRVGTDHYHVNWHARDFDLDPATTYRIRVVVDGVELGFADVELGASQGELKNVNTNEFVPLLDGRTLPIRFRIEHGGVCLSPPAGMVGWWTGDATTADHAGANDGSFPYGGGFTTGLVGDAFSFDGYDDFLLVPDAADGSLDFDGDFSIDAWIKLTSPTPGKTDDIAFKILHAPGETFSAGYALRLQPDTYPGGKVIAFQLTPDGFVSDVVFSTAAVPVDTWTHVVAVRVGGTAQLYVNGALDATTALAVTSGVSLANPSPLAIGGIWDTRFGAPFTQLGNNFGGLVDEVELFNRALTPYEVANLFNAGPSGKCK